MTDSVQFLETAHGTRIAYRGGEVAGKPTIVFLHGHGSDMDGTKALAVADWARDNGFGMLRFECSGHGQSSGDMLDGTIGAWKADCLAAIDNLTTAPLIIIGSSLGGWLMMLVARERAERIRGIIGIAAAPDFTRDLIWNELTPDQQAEMIETGKIAMPNQYDPVGEVIYPYRLITEGDDHLILKSDKKIRLDCPVRLLHGMKDIEVPPATAERLAAIIDSPDMEVVFDETADHRFSEPAQLDILLACLADITLKAESQS